MGDHEYNNKRSRDEDSGVLYSEEDMGETESEDSFDIKLLEAVKNNPCIYDVKIKEKEDIITVWEKIACSLGTDAEICKSRYKRLREYTAKERKRRENCTSEENSVKGWYLYDKAKFLKPFIKRKRTYKKMKIDRAESVVTSYKVDNNSDKDLKKPLLMKNNNVNVANNEENENLAKLIVSRLRNIVNVTKKNAFVLEIMNILYK